MKYIAKGNAPAVLTRWFEGQKNEQGEYINVTYRMDLPPYVKQIIHQQLISEQGALCCYTGLRITEANSHIEHFFPLHQCHNHEDVDYANLLAAFGTDKKQELFGAHMKAGWYDRVLLINPMRQSCESSFKFDKIGGIKAAHPDNVAAKTTIKKLKLDHPSLIEMRKQAIDSALYRQQLGIRKLEQLSQSFCSLNQEGKYRPFCFVIAQVAARSLEGAKRRARQKQTLNKASKKR